MAGANRTVTNSSTRRAAAVDEEETSFAEARVSAWPVRFASVVIGILWFTQIIWKLPWDHFGTPTLQPNPNPTTEQPGPYLDSGTGLYHWMTLEAKHAILPFYGDLIKNAVLPNWELVGWLTVLMETAIMLMLLLGLLTRLGGFLGLMQALNLFVGLSAAPGEWYWSYLMLATLQFVFMMTGPGRVWGLDARLRPRLRQQAAAGSNMAAWLYRLT